MTGAVNLQVFSSLWCTILCRIERQVGNLCSKHASHKFWSLKPFEDSGALRSKAIAITMSLIEGALSLYEHFCHPPFFAIVLTETNRQQVSEAFTGELAAVSFDVIASPRMISSGRWDRTSLAPLHIDRHCTCLTLLSVHRLLQFWI